MLSRTFSPKRPATASLLPWSLAVSLACLTACDSAPPSEDTAEEPAPAPSVSTGPAPGDHAFTTADGNRLPYTVGGNADADVTLVFVHCWMCDRTFWDAQLPAVQGSYRTVTLDLPGHGAASAEREAWTVQAFGDDVAALVQSLDLGDVVLVGHSMGGPVSLRAASLLPGQVQGIVAVDTLHDADFKWEGEEIEGMMRAFEADFTGTCSNFVHQMFPEEGVEAIVEKVRSSGCDGSRAAVGTALMQDFANLDMPAWFQGAGVPIRAINAAAPSPTQVEGNRAYADFDAAIMEGVGHYPHMTRPDEFNPLLMEALDQILATADGA
ncbi:MAG: alpha/beta hydrolase [Acidobacteriota bacterium]